MGTFYKKFFFLKLTFVEGNDTDLRTRKVDILGSVPSLPSCSPAADTLGIIYGDINFNYRSLV